MPEPTLPQMPRSLALHGTGFRRKRRPKALAARRSRRGRERRAAAEHRGRPPPRRCASLHRRSRHDPSGRGAHPGGGASGGDLAAHRARGDARGARRTDRLSRRPAGARRDRPRRRLARSPGGDRAFPGSRVAARRARSLSHRHRFSCDAHRRSRRSAPITSSSTLSRSSGVFEAPLAFLMDPAQSPQSMRANCAGQDAALSTQCPGRAIISGATAGMIRILYDGSMRR